jgi:ATP-dependent DNA ligase
MERMPGERSAACRARARRRDDGRTLFDGVVEHGLEGVVVKRRNAVYRPGYRGWTKVKNPTYWRRASEVESIGLHRDRLATA